MRVLGSPRSCHTAMTSTPLFLNTSTSPSRNRLCRSLISPLKLPCPTRLSSTVYMRNSKQREFGAVFVPSGGAIFGPHGAGGPPAPPLPRPLPPPAPQPPLARLPPR